MGKKQEKQLAKKAKKDLVRIILEMLNTADLATHQQLDKLNVRALEIIHDAVKTLKQNKPKDHKRAIEKIEIPDSEIFETLSELVDSMEFNWADGNLPDFKQLHHAAMSILNDLKRKIKDQLWNNIR